jgi:mono/diheme cytochrome c family protein
MKKTLLFATLLTTIFSFDLSAAAYKGQKEFVKQCVECHDTGQAFVASRTMSDWKKLMKKKGKALAEAHLGNEKAKKSWEYFEDKRFTKMSKHLADFLEEYAKDSGNVPACN